MAHIALYRAWRSQTFAELVGQQHIVQTLQNALKENRLNHAYLFCGPRGTGKTSTAKIFAKALNCPNGSLEEPCNICSICMRITEGTLLDVIEIDAASNRGIEEIRELRDQVKYAPSETKYKVYIIDEVHMLTTEAFNALLKTLEEPPSHVIFIFATTEAHKLPLTIISRCQRYDFRRVSLQDQVQRLNFVCEQEGIQIHSEALHYIARLSDGGMRDALSLLDQLHAYCTHQIELADVIAITGGIPSEEIEKLVRAVKAQQVDQVLEIIDKMMQDGKSADKCLEHLIDYFRDLLLILQAPNSIIIEERIFDVPRRSEIAKTFQPYEIYKIMESLVRDQNEMKYTAQPQTIFEMAVMKISSTSFLQTQGSSTETYSQIQQQDQLFETLLGRIQKLEAQVENLTHVPIIQQQVSVTNTETISKTSTSSRPVMTKAQSTTNKPNSTWSRFVDAVNTPQTRDALMKWNQILNAVKSKKVTVHAWLVNGELVAMQEGEMLIAFKNEMHRNTSDKPENKQMIEEIASRILEKPVKMITVMRQDWDETVNKGITSVQEDFTLIQEDETKDEKEPWIKEALDIFGPDIVEIKKE